MLIAGSFVAFISGLGSVRGAMLEGELPRSRDFAQYVGKFCYDFGSSIEEMIGEVQIDTFRDSPLPETSRGKLYFMLYDDERRRWKKARKRWESSTCQEKIDDASLVQEIEVHTDNQTTTYMVNIREHIRPRFWYFAFVSCGMKLHSVVRYQVHATNNVWGWQQEFSLDQMGMVSMYALFTVLFSLATLATAWASRWRAPMQDPPIREHPYLHFLLLSYIASSASCALFLLHYLLYSHNGYGSQRLRFLAVLSSIVANCTIFLISILASVGWAISARHLPNRRVFLGLVTFVGGLTALCELRAETAVDQSTKLYNYQSGAGVMTLIVKIFMFCWFAYQTKSTHDEELNQQHRRFFKVLGISVSGWSLNVPVAVLLAFSMPPWSRYKVVTTVEVIARFIGQALLAHLFCGPLSPITAENTFPSRSTDHSGFDTCFDQMPDEHGDARSSGFRA